MKNKNNQQSKQSTKGKTNACGEKGCKGKKNNGETENCGK